MVGKNVQSQDSSLQVKKQIDLFATSLACLLIQHVMSKNNSIANKKIESKYGKLSR